MGMQSNIQQLHHAIKQNAEQLLACLSRELEILNSHNYKDLVNIASEKQELIQILDDLEKQRQSLSPESDYLNHLKQIDNSGTLVNGWNSILETIRQCNHQNEVNGRLINRMNQIARETLDIFTGNNSNSDVTYSPEGLKKGLNTQLTNTRA